MYRPFVIALFFFGSAFFVSAQVEITEIMYDLEGSDTDREWVEIYNSGPDDIDLQDWRFVEVEGENEKRHTFLPYPKENGDVVIRSNSYAVIVIKPESFLNDWSGFSGKILDSSFSLRQKDDIGEKLIIRDSEGNDINSVTYDPLWGASGDGNSLQRSNGNWISASPTVGKANATATSEPLPQQDDDNNDQQESVSNNVQDAVFFTTASSQVKPTPKISAHAGPRERVVIAGTKTKFEGSAQTAGGDDISSARRIWNFGDGSRAEGGTVSHIYHYPGEYLVVLDVASGIYAATDRIKVTVISADFHITEVGPNGGFIELENSTSYELDMSEWIILSGANRFVFPKGTIILPQNKIMIASQTVGFSFDSKQIILLYPNGREAVVYNGAINDQEHYSESSPLDEEKEEKGNLFAKQKVIFNEAGGVIPPASLIKGIEEKTGQKTTIENIGKENSQEPLQSNLAQLALVKSNDRLIYGQEGSSDPPKQKDDGLFWGLMGVSLLSLIAIYVILGTKGDEYTIGIKSEADLYKIIEIDDD
ncbi:MAG: lamin tail domain-containing protein [Candidatus Pacebacteria bacterium]|nr:lamin tail domain-containing protein [Candidatus Paceibacterota bacterium]